MRPTAAIFAWAAMCAVAPIAGRAESLPLWELGVGVGALRLNDYRGSDHWRSYVLPVPLVIYRGERLKADRNGVRGMLVDTDRFELSLSAGATPPVGRGNGAREGMPNLKPTLELGPLASLTLWRSDDRMRKLDLRLPLRAAMTLDRHPAYEGWVFAPNLNLDLFEVGATPEHRGWNVGVLVGPEFASRRQNDYFYGVAPAFATPTRPAYDARGGYGGMRALVSVTRRFAQTWVGAYVRRDTLHGAVFEDSPLVRSRAYNAFGVAVTWVLGASSTQVDAEP